MTSRSERLTQNDKLKIATSAGDLPSSASQDPFSDLNWHMLVPKQIPRKFVAIGLAATIGLTGCGPDDDRLQNKNLPGAPDRVPASPTQDLLNGQIVPSEPEMMAIFAAGSTLFTPEIEGVYAHIRNPDQSIGLLRRGLFDDARAGIGSSRLRKAIDHVVNNQITISPSQKGTWDAARPHLQDYLHILLGTAEEAADFKIGPNDILHHPQLDAIVTSALAIDSIDPNGKPFIDIASGTFDINGKHPVQVALQSMNARNPRITTIENHSPPNKYGSVNVGRSTALVFDIDVTPDAPIGKKPRNVAAQYVYVINSDRYDIDQNGRVSNQAQTTKTAFLHLPNNPNTPTGPTNVYYEYNSPQPRRQVSITERNGLNRVAGFVEVVPFKTQSYEQFRTGPGQRAANLGKDAHTVATWRRHLVDFLSQRQDIVQEVASAHNSHTSDEFAKLLKKLLEMSSGAFKQPPNMSPKNTGVQKKDPRTLVKILPSISCTNPPIGMLNTLYVGGCAFSAIGVYDQGGTITQEPCTLSLAANSAAAVKGTSILPSYEDLVKMGAALRKKPVVKQLGDTNAQPHIVACGIRLTPDELDQPAGQEQWDMRIAAQQADLRTQKRQARM